MNLKALRKRLGAIDETAAAKAKQIEEIWAKDTEDEGLSEDDRSEVVELTKSLESLKSERREVEASIELAEEVRETSKGMGRGVHEVDDLGGVEVVPRSEAEVKSLGDQFIESQGYKSLLDGGMSGEWSSGPIELDTKGTLASTPGTALNPRQYQPGIVQTLYQRNYVSDLLGQMSTTASQVTYVSETTATNAAAATAEQGTKPESTLAFGETTENVRKIATLLPVTEEMLQDAPQIQAYINQRLQLFIMNTEEAEILLGSGTAPHIQGLIGAGRNSVGTYARGTVDDNALALFKAMNGTRGSSQLDMDAIVIHPTNWQAIRTAKDTSGQYYGGGPFYGPYGGPQGPAGASQFSADNLWGVRVVVTSNITVGSALVGAFAQGGAVVRRSGITVDASNSHSTWFANNITALRAEERLALAVYRQSAFTVVTGLS